VKDCLRDTMKDRGALESLIERLVLVEGFSSQHTSLLDPPLSDLDLKIALLSLVLEELRYERNSDSETVEFEDYVRCSVFTKNETIVIAASENYKSIGAGTTPIQLQSALLLFLLVHHRERYSVLEIIRHFIEKIRSHLTFVDFKKTKTGVTRCFTNTRFAAKVLREYGLLKFTDREAFKTWELSLTGFVVAASILGSRRHASAELWVPSPPNSETHFDLLHEVRTACDDMNYDTFVERLASICKPNVNVFETFHPALISAYELLDDYWKILKNSELKQKERKEASRECIKRLAQGGIRDGFYSEFSNCIKSQF
jgi:hypothetical protein